MTKTFMYFLWRRHRVAVVLCGLVPLIVGTLIGLVYPTFAKERALLKVFKMSTRFFGQDKMDLFSPEGAFSLPFQHPLVLIAYAVMPAIVAMALVAGDRGRGSLDLLLATSISRRFLNLAVGTFQALCCLYLSTTCFLGCFLAAAISGDASAFNPGSYTVIALTAFGLTGVFGGFASLVSLGAENRGQATLRYGILIFSFFIIDVAARLWRDGEWLAYLSPYGYLRPAKVLTANVDVLLGREPALLIFFALVLRILVILLHDRRHSA